LEKIDHEGLSPIVLFSSPMDMTDRVKVWQVTKPYNGFLEAAPHLGGEDL